MLGARSCLVGGTLTVVLVAAIATGAPTPPAAATHVHASTPASRAHDALAADAQLITALRARIGAAKLLERATLAAVDQRLRAIYALPGETPLLALLTGNVAQAQAMMELTSAMEQSDDNLLSSYTSALANLQTAQAELDQNVLRVDAQLRIAAAQRAAARARTNGQRSTPTGSAPPPVASGGTGSGGLPATIIAQHSLPGQAPVNPVTGRPIVASG
jgi:uncharacterized protein